AARISSKYRDITSRTASESSFSPIAVEPFRSEKTIVTVFRTSCAGSCGASADPQNPQRRNFAGFSSPQFGQICTKGSLGTPSREFDRTAFELRDRHPARSACPRSGPVEGVWGNREVPPASLDPVAYASV